MFRANRFERSRWDNFSLRVSVGFMLKEVAVVAVFSRTDGRSSSPAFHGSAGAFVALSSIHVLDVAPFADLLKLLSLLNLLLNVDIVLDG